MLQSKDSERMDKQNKTPRPIYMPSIRDSFQTSSHLQIESKKMEKHLSCNGCRKTARVAILISDALDFKPKTVIRDKKRTLYNKGDNPTKMCNNRKYLCTQYGST